MAAATALQQQPKRRVALLPLCGFVAPLVSAVATCDKALIDDIEKAENSRISFSFNLQVCYSLY